MTKFFNHTLLSIAVAIFSMFFGAGNAIFPLIVGRESQNQFIWAFIGLFLTAIGGPLLGLTTATLFKGKFKTFFFRAGKIPGIILVFISLALLGPFAVMPRCVTVAYAALTPFFTNLPLAFFALIFSILAMISCWKRRFLLPILGYVLSPLLILCLLIIILQSALSPNSIQTSTLTFSSAFTLGLHTGYDTMDLIASIFFSSGIWTLVSIKFKNQPNKIFKTTIQSGIIACTLLALIYFGLTFSAAKYADLLQGVPQEQIMSILANATLGPTFGFIANLAIALACLTTVISLAMTIADIAYHELIPKKQIPYKQIVCLLLLITTLMANLGFSSIMMIIHPALTICYPLIILLTLYNLFYTFRKSFSKKK